VQPLKRSALPLSYQNLTNSCRIKDSVIHLPSVNEQCEDKAIAISCAATFFKENTQENSVQPTAVHHTTRNTYQ
jgi:hypothetical protein